MAKKYVNHVKGQPITRNTDNIRVEGRIGTWYVIDETYHRGCKIFLLEHEIYGDEAACIAVDKNGKVVCEDIYDDFPDCLDCAENHIEVPIFSEEMNEDGSYDIIGYRKEYTD